MAQPAQTSDRKLYLGPRLRLLRRELGISQTRMAEELGVSPSYLNHLERNQRPLTAQMLLRLANTYDLDVRDFVSGAAAARDDSALQDAMADPLVRDLGVARDELLELGENYPGIASALVRFHGALTDLRRAPSLIDQLTAAQPITTPVEWLDAQLTVRRNHFAALETAAEALDLPADPAQRMEAMRALLDRKFHVRLMWAGRDILGPLLRHYDFHRRRLMLAETLPAASRAFGVAYQLAALALADPVEQELDRADPPDQQSRTLLKIALLNYAAGAMLMPYAAFHAAAEASRYHPEVLQGRFGTSYEQVAHRLTTLDRNGARGIGFFLMRIDDAGNVSKRIAGGHDCTLLHSGEGCPRWALADARLDETAVRVVAMPDGGESLTLVRRVGRPGQESGRRSLIVVLGCDSRHAARIALADGLSADAGATDVGPGCRLCERPGCPDRAWPPISRSLELSSIQRPISPYPFRPI